MWNEFLTTFVSSIIANHIIKWDTASIPHYTTTYYRSPNSTNLYTKSNDSLITHTPREYKRLQGLQRYNIQGMIVNPSTEIITNLIPMDAAHYKTYLQYLCDSSINTHGETESPPNIKSLSHMYNRLPTSLQRLCGAIQFPSDDGKQLIDYLTNHNLQLQGMSDASLKEDQCSHAWILTTGAPEHITDPKLHIKGSGAVDGHASDLSSARGELQGQTATAVISKLLLDAHNTNIPTTLMGDNQGVQKQCSNISQSKLRHHRSPNIDLHLEYKAATAGRVIKNT